jgi:predicted Fe-Mo cluster-binding NifX family protein
VRVAVFTDEGGLQDRVSYHFGRARTVTIVDLDDMNPLRSSRTRMELGEEVEGPYPKPWLEEELML